KKARVEHIEKMSLIAKMFADQGILVVCSFVSPYKSIRNRAKRIVGEDRFFEVFVKADQSVCIKRDVKGHYQKALDGKIKNFTGLNSVYEKPLNPNLICD